MTDEQFLVLVEYAVSTVKTLAFIGFGLLAVGVFGGFALYAYKSNPANGSDPVDEDLDTDVAVKVTGDGGKKVSIPVKKLDTPVTNEGTTRVPVSEKAKKAVKEAKPMQEPRIGGEYIHTMLLTYWRNKKDPVGIRQSLALLERYYLGPEEYDKTRTVSVALNEDLVDDKNPVEEEKSETP